MFIGVKLHQYGFSLKGEQLVHRIVRGAPKEMLGGLTIRLPGNRVIHFARFSDRPANKGWHCTRI